ncbi:MAG: DUF302 domain-containing protein [Cyanobacteria bacterium P01_A01_bin.116]
MKFPGKNTLVVKQILGFGGVIALLFIAMAVGSRPGASLPVPSPTGLVIKQSPHSVEDTQQRFVSILEERGLNVFATIDHAQNAEGAGLSLRPTRVVIFGNPKLGTPLMECGPSLAIDLPQKMLIWEGDDGQVQIAYNDPRYLGGRHQLGACGNEVIQTIAGALDNFSNGAIAP